MEGKSKALPGPQVVRTLISAQAVNAIGDGAFYVVSAIYFARVVGLHPVQIGTGLTVAWLIGFLLAAPLGQLGDRVGLRRAAVALSLVTALSLVLVTVPRSVAGFMAVVAVYAVAQSGSGAVRQALLVTLVPSEDRVIARARLQASVNAGIGVGAALGALALLSDRPSTYAVVFVLDAATFVAAAVLLRRLPAVADRRALRGRSDEARPPRRAGVWQDRPYVTLSMLNAVLYLYMPMLSVVLPLYVVQRTAAPAWTVGAFFVLNTVGVTLLQVRAARTVTDPHSAVVALRRAGLALLLACLVFAAAAHTSSVRTAVVVLVLAGTLQVVGEVLLASASWEIGFAFADPARPGQWQGLYSSGVPLARALGPLLLTGLVLTWSGPGWMVLGAVFVGASLLAGPAVTWAERTRILPSVAPEEPEAVGSSRARAAS